MKILNLPLIKRNGKRTEQLKKIYIKSKNNISGLTKNIKTDILCKFALSPFDKIPCNSDKTYIHNERIGISYIYSLHHTNLKNVFIVNGNYFTTHILRILLNKTDTEIISYIDTDKHFLTSLKNIIIYFIKTRHVITSVQISKQLNMNMKKNSCVNNLYDYIYSNKQNIHFHKIAYHLYNIYQMIQNKKKINIDTFISSTDTILVQLLNTVLSDITTVFYPDKSVIVNLEQQLYDDYYMNYPLANTHNLNKFDNIMVYLYKVLLLLSYSCNHNMQINEFLTNEYTNQHLKEIQNIIKDKYEFENDTNDIYTVAVNLFDSLIRSIDLTDQTYLLNKNIKLNLFIWYCILFTKNKFRDDYTVAELCHTSNPLVSLLPEKYIENYPANPYITHSLYNLFINIVHSL